MTQLTIVTTQNVSINFTAASVGERILAQIIDILIMVAYAIVVGYLLDILGFNTITLGKDKWSIMAISIIIFSPIIFYTLVQETFLEGQTIGKKVVRIKVIKIDGYQAGFGDYLIRWLFRTVEVFIGSGVIGLLAIIFSSKNQRIGDIAAGTAVITLKNNININHTILEEVNQDYVPVYPLVIKLSDNDMRIIKETFELKNKVKDAIIAEASYDCN